MNGVPDRTLQWLYGILNSQYHDVNRAYFDVARTLSQNPSIAPRTDTYTFENGAAALLLLLHGTIPVSFRGTTYRFPIAIWVPHAYPRDSPMVYIRPEKGMAIRPSQHVSLEGRIYHPYLAKWADHWDKSSIQDFISIMQEIFAREPPVAAKVQQAQPPARPNMAGNAPPPIPPHPAELQTQVRSPLNNGAPGPAPAPPPKPPETRQGSAGQHQDRVASSTGPPPLPPKPGRSDTYPTENIGRDRDQYRQYPAMATPSEARSREWSTSSVEHSPYDARPAQYFSPQAAQQPHRPGVSSSGGQLQQPYRNHTIQAAPQQGVHGLMQQAQYHSSHHQPQQQQQQQQQTQPFQQPRPLPAPQPPPPQQKPKQPLPDLLSGSIEAILPSQSAATAPPPIPPNPEKDALLSAISTSLRNELENTISRNTAAVHSLSAQNNAMQQAYANMQHELQQLQEFEGLLNSNERILRETMQTADQAMQEVQKRDVPDVDSVLVAPTVVGEQLYRLVCEERAIGEAMFVLQRALDRGRISGEVYVKQTRGLAREQFLKKALIKKIAKGMGLTGV